MTYGVQNDGSFRRKHVDRIRDDLYRAFLDAAGDDVELNGGSPQSQPLDAVAIELGRAWQALEETYYASYYEDSFGEQLDKHLSLANFQRLELQPATGEVTFSRDSPAPDDITIPSGTVVQTRREETRPPIPFETVEPARINEGETEVSGVSIEALKPFQTDLGEQWLGEETNVSAGTITQFQNPVSGVASVTNPSPTGDAEQGFQRGRDRENDAEFKLRYQNELGSDGRATIRAIQSRIFDADPDIKAVNVDQRHDKTANEYGVEVVVLAPDVDDDTIAEAIFFSKAGGLDSFGAESGGVEWASQIRTESFDRATQVDIEIEATLYTTNTFPDDGFTRVEDALIEYIGGGDSAGVRQTGLTIGDDVIYDQILTRIVQQQGITEVDLETGRLGDPLGSANIPMGIDETPRLDVSNITLTIN